ncbi:DUF6061 family protein [Hominifimenecus microfluidus]
MSEYSPQLNSIDVYTSAGYMLRIDCWEAEKNLKTTPRSDCALTSLAVDEPLEYVILSRLVDTFFSRISLTMQLHPKPHSTAYVLPWEEVLHWQCRSSDCSSS